MSVRSSISRREPVIALESFRYRGRNYKEGSFLDRRRCRMPNSRLRKFLRGGLCILAKDVEVEKLIEYGWTYDNHATRNKLIKLDLGTTLLLKNQALINTFGEDDDETDPDDDSSPEPTMKHMGGGWYDVMVKGEAINDKGLRKDDALFLITDLTGGE